MAGSNESLNLLTGLINTFNDQSVETSFACKKCKGILFRTKGGTTASDVIASIHDYEGKNMEKVNSWWVLQRLSQFENISVSKPIQFPSQENTNNTISKLCPEVDKTNNKQHYQLRYLLCAGPPISVSSGSNMNDLMSLFSKQKPASCEKFIVGIAVFIGQDMKIAYIAKDRIN